MKKILLLVLFLLLTGSIFAQPMHYNALSGMTNESFTSTTFPPAGWRRVNVMGSNQWYRYTYAPHLHTPPGSARIIYQSTGGEDWLITPQISVSGSDSLIFWAARYYPTIYEPDSLIVRVSTTDTALTSFTHVLGRYNVNSFGCAQQGTYNRIALFMGTYTGNAWVAFQHKDNDGGGMLLDDISVVTAVTIGPVPEIIYYRFENNPSYRTVLNYAIPGQSSGSGILNGTTALTSGGQFDSCIIGNGVSGGGVNTRWNCSLGSGSWTISMWVHIPSDLTGVGYYLFGDVGSNSFRCFHYGISGSNYNLRLRSAGMTDVVVNGIGPAPTVVHIVYNSAASEIRTYKNGVYNSTVPQTPLNLPAGSGFWVGGYPAAYPTMKGRMDEFRVYSRALDSTEIALTWNHELPLLTSIPTPVLNMPVEFALSQNYPNPFNPTTTIEYKIPTKEMVILKVYDILGKEIATLVNEVKRAGSYTVEFNGSNLPSGTYFYRLEAGDNLDVKKMLLIK